jgi:hypothetical protein
MSVTFNFPALSSIQWLPVKFVTPGEDYVTKFTPISFQDGTTFGLNNCLENFKDISFNKKTGMFLTDVCKASDILEDSSVPSLSAGLTEIFSPICTVDPFYNNKLIVLSSNYQLSASSKVATNQYGVQTAARSVDNFNFIFSRDITHALSNAEEDFVSVETAFYSKSNQLIPDQFLLTWNINDNSLSFQPRIFPDSRSQQFSYLLSPSGICLFKPDTNFSIIVDRNLLTNVYEFTPYTASSFFPIPETSFLKFVSYQNIPFKKTDIVDSHLTKYVVNKLDYQQEIIPDIETNQSDYFQNFLGMFPVEKPVLEKDFATYSLQIHGLKNYQTPEYNYSFNKNYVDGYSGVHRVYDRIFSGTNQKEGLANVHLGYTANSSELKFPKDKETPFNFTPTAHRIPLCSAGFIEDGAIPGHHPFVSDRIYLRQTDYNNQNQGIPQPSSISKFSNTWLCAWLSGSNGGDSMWMDRFYNAAYYTYDQALSATPLAYHDKTNADLSYIYDTPSTMYLEPGAFYRYYHSGLLTSQNYVPFLDGTLNSPLGSKVLHVCSWNNNPLEDNSVYKNNGLVYPASLQNIDTDFWKLDGTNHAVFPSKNSLLESHHFTTSLWVKVDDWSNIKGSQIFGNFYNSGYGLINETAPTAPLISFIDKSSGQLYNLNYKFKIVNYSEVPVTEETGNVLIVRLPDFSYWVFDSNNGTGIKYDIEGIKIKILTKKYFRISQIETDEYSNLYLYQPYKKKVTVLSSEGVLLNNLSYRLKNRSTKRIELFNYKSPRNSFSNTSIIEVFGNTSVIDNEGHLWQVLGSNLYKSTYDPISDSHSSPVFFATLGITQQITCDSYNNIWILHDIDKISILKPNQRIFQTFRKGKRSGLPEDPCLRDTNRYRYINFVKTAESSTVDCKTYNYKDLAVIVDVRDNELMLLDFSGDLITRLDLTALYDLKSSAPVFCADGDFTGYQHLRKFKYTNNNLGWKFRIAESNGNNPETITLHYNSSLLHPGWHHFAFSFDAENGTASYYIDSVLVDFKRIDISKQLWFDYKSSLLLGIDSVKNSNLNDLINIEDAYKFIGEVADLRVYSKSLSQGDVEQLYFSFKYSDERKPLVWNMSTGKRNYIENIKHWFQLQLPGSKSKYFNINIHNLKAPLEVRAIIEDAIRKNISKLSPAHTSLYKINWV